MSLLFGGQGIEIDEPTVKDSRILGTLRCEAVRNVRGCGGRLLRCIPEKLRVLANLKGQIDQRRDNGQPTYEVTDVA
ncbi:MAG: hypothetical protein JRG92_02665 [Deltaproteobacteria bacterium]|nr:hypothetical protein [Deltaproteobacteria bacterium]